MYGEYILLIRNEDKEAELECVKQGIVELMKSAILTLEESGEQYKQGTGEILIKDNQELGLGYFSVGIRFETEKV